MASIKSRIKAINTAILMFSEKLEQLYRTKYTHSEIRSLKSDIEALEYMKERLKYQQLKANKNDKTGNYKRANIRVPKW